MPREPLRFIHAARLWLDHQLRDTGPLPAALRDIAENAAVTAFERVIDACLEHQVDFLLLSGNCFHREDHGLRGQIALARGLARLNAQEIPVFIASGTTDPWSAWLPGLRLTDNVHRLDLDSDSPASIRIDEQVVATVTAAAHDELPVPAPESPFSIALLPAELDTASRTNTTEPGRTAPDSLPKVRVPDLAASRFHYWALGGGTHQRTVPIGQGAAHDPGSPQGFHPGETGPHGCTLVDVDAAGQRQQTFIPTAVVRWEEATAHITPAMQREDLLITMRAALCHRERFPTDKLWLVAWEITGSGPLYESLRDAQFRDELWTELNADSGMTDVTVHTRCMNFALPDSHRLAGPHWSPEKVLASSYLHGGPWEQRLLALTGELDLTEIRNP